MQTAVLYLDISGVCKMAKGKTKTALILEALEEKYNLKKSRRDLIRESAGWLSADEAAELREAMAIFDQVDEED